MPAEAANQQANQETFGNGTQHLIWKDPTKLRQRVNAI
jgi:hypothetical protein